jgi:hypothetical protein
MEGVRNEKERGHVLIGYVASNKHQFKNGRAEKERKRADKNGFFWHNKKKLQRSAERTHSP